jgi:hypothetical protein
VDTDHFFQFNGFSDFIVVTRAWTLVPVVSTIDRGQRSRFIQSTHFTCKQRGNDRHHQPKPLKMPPPQDDKKRQAAREVIDILHEIATLLVRL